MKTKISNSPMDVLTVITVSLLTVLTFSSCRQESDDVLNYAYQDEMAFGGAERSYAAKFDVVWKGMNANYALWDYEYAQGLDWDRVYDIYYPKFAALDTMKEAVTDAQLKELLDSVIAPLHDGHLMVQMKNHATGKYVGSSPGALRLVREHLDEYNVVGSRKMSLAYYEKTGALKEHKSINSNTLETVALRALAYLEKAVARLDSVPESERTQAQNDTLALYTQIAQELTSPLARASILGDKSGIQDYNNIAYKYLYLHIPYLEPIDPVLSEMGLTVTYALFKDNVAYLYFDGFKLSAYLEPLFITEFFGGCNDATKALVKDVGDVWRAWFDAIQEHHQAGDLKGVIIDVRGNGGGFLNDSKYVLGALMPAGGFQDCNARFKRGSGRFDYSPLLPQIMPTMDSAHVTVTEPVVVLCNCMSVSMAEHTSYGAKIMENGTLIGTRTWGGFSALSSTETYTNNYAGYVGIKDVTPVFCYVPQEVAFTLDGKVVEGYGIDPDIEVELDAAALDNGSGPDSQLDRALQFIKTGN